MKRLAALGVGLALLWGTAARAADTVYYYYTDEQGTPEVMADAQGNVIERTEYAPYGQVLNRPEHDGPGYTGHEEDAQTGLTNMQQRYGDKIVGRMDSVDPLEVDTTTGANFNRYAYANDNPYRFTDPDGRCTGSHISNSDGTCASTGAFTTGVSAEPLAWAQARTLLARTSSPQTRPGQTPAPRQNRVDNTPNRFTIENKKTENDGSYSIFHYQLRNAHGNALTGNGSVEEHISGQVSPDRLQTAEGTFVPMVRGEVLDEVGYSTPPGKGFSEDAVVYQTFTVKYAGKDYDLTTEFKHETLNVDGAVTNTVTNVVQ